MDRSINTASSAVPGGGVLVSTGRCALGAVKLSVHTAYSGPLGVAASSQDTGEVRVRKRSGEIMTPKDSVESLASDPSEVADKLASGFVDSWNRHDMASFADLFHSDASFVNVVGVLMEDREEIERVHSAAHAGPFLTSTLQFQVEAVRTIVPGIIVAHLHCTLLGDARDPSGERQSLLTFVIELRGESWRIIAAQNTNISSPPEQRGMRS